VKLYFTRNLVFWIKIENNLIVTVTNGRKTDSLICSIAKDFFLTTVLSHLPNNSLLPKEHLMFIAFIT